MMDDWIFWSVLGFVGEMVNGGEEYTDASKKPTRKPSEATVHEKGVRRDPRFGATDVRDACQLANDTSSSQLLDILHGFYAYGYSGDSWSRSPG